jgi:glycosyltransferase involved in cell wall biosynthesis
LGTEAIEGEPRLAPSVAGARGGAVRIALVNTSLLPGRGSDQIVHELALGLSGAYEVTVYAPFGAQLHSERYRLVAPRAAVHWWERLRRLLALRRELRDFDVVNCHHALLSLLLPRARLVTTYHGYRGRLHFRFGRRVAAWTSAVIRATLIGAALRRSRAVTVVSRSLLAEVERVGLRVPAVLIYNGVVAEASLDAPLPSGRGEYFLYLGRLEPDKSVERLLELYQASDLRAPLWVAGDGAERSRLERRWAADVRIRFLGNRAREEVPGLLAGAIAFVTASSYETFCLPVVEAAALGRPSVGPCSGSLPELITPGESGYLYGSAAQFSAALSALVQLPETERLRRAHFCREWARRFTLPAMHAAYHELFDALCSREQPRHG